MVLLLAQSGHRTGRLDSFLIPQHVDGVLLLSLHDDDTLPESIRARDLPVVLGGQPGGREGFGFVDVDNELGARLAVSHLVERGRAHIATIAGPADMVAGRTGSRATSAGWTRPDGRPTRVSRRPATSARTAARPRCASSWTGRPELDGVFAPTT